MSDDHTLLSQSTTGLSGFFDWDIFNPSHALPIAVQASNVDHERGLPGVNYRLGSHPVVGFGEIVSSPQRLKVGVVAALLLLLRIA